MLNINIKHHHQAMFQLKLILNILQTLLFLNKLPMFLKDQFKHHTFKAHHHMFLPDKPFPTALDLFKLDMFLQDQEQDTAEEKTLLILLPPTKWVEEILMYPEALELEEDKQSLTQQLQIQDTLHTLAEKLLLIQIQTIQDILHTLEDKLLPTQPIDHDHI